jgi:PhoH-like ATPase
VYNDESETWRKMTQSLKKTYVLDTNVLLSDASSLFAFQEHDVIIPMAVLEELDNHKSRQDEVGQNARKISRTLDEMRDSGESLFNGVTLPNGGTLKIVSIDSTDGLPPELDREKVDNQLIAFMLQLRSQESDQTTVLVSKDINVRLKCDGLNIRCDDYRKMRVVTDTDKFYTGVATLDVTDEQIQEFFQTGFLALDEEATKPLFPNQIIILKSPPSKSGIARFLGQKEPLIKIAPVTDVFGLKPRNKEQNFSFDLLLDREVKLLTLTGRAGTGKTLLALAAGLQQLKGLGPKETAVYDKIIVTRPVQPLGRDIGFLPGSLEEKMEPWIAPIRDNLNFLMQHRSVARRPKTGDGKEPYLSLLQSRGLIEIEAITFIRGRSIPNSMIIIDEAQNLSMHELKTIITRVGDGTKIVLTGDIEQIDNTHVDVFTNGLTYAIEKFKEYDIAAHVTLLKGERSPLATIASKIL